MSACDPIARESDIKPSADLADTAHTNTLRLADEVNSLRARVKELEDDNARTADWIAKLTKADVEQIENLQGFIKHYNEHLEKNH